MMRIHTLNFIALCLLFSNTLLAWQYDAELFLRNPLARFIAKDGLSVLPSAQSEIRLGKYIDGDEHHSWRGGVEGDVTLLSFSPHLLWHWNLNMETLADDKNDINFRLVQVYYQSLTGISLHIGPGVWSGSYSHRCSHGADGSIIGRILIRSGLQSSYEMPFSYKKIQFLFHSTLTAYLMGQNADLAHQSRGQAVLALQMMWPIKGAWWMLFASSFGEELITTGTSTAFAITAPARDMRLRPYGGARIGMRINGEKVINDYALSFSHVPDTGFGSSATAHNGLSFDISFQW